jgi:NTE family protein
MDVYNFRHSAALMDLGYASAQSYLGERKQLPTAIAPAEMPVRTKVTAALRTSIATQTNLARLRTDAIKGLWLRRRSVPVPLPVDKTRQ